MTVPVTSSWEEISANGGAYRPALSTTLGGALLQDETGKAAPATDGSELYGVMVNQWVRQIAALARTIDPIRITIDWSAGNPFVAAFDACSSTILITDFALTKNGTGDVTIDLLAWKIPPLSTDPIGTVNSISLTTPNIGVIVVASPPSGHLQWRAVVKDGSTATNARFTVRL